VYTNYNCHLADHVPTTDEGLHRKKQFSQSFIQRARGLRDECENFKKFGEENQLALGRS